jgi:hypothetical protein
MEQAPKVLIGELVKHAFDERVRLCSVMTAAVTTKLPGNGVGTKTICLREHDKGQVAFSPTILVQLLLQHLECRILGMPKDGSQHRCRK